MRYDECFVPFGLSVTLVVGAAGPAAARETRTVEGYDVTVGGVDEPPITGERTWPELEPYRRSFADFTGTSL